MELNDSVDRVRVTRFCAAVFFPCINRLRLYGGIVYGWKKKNPSKDSVNAENSGFYINFSLKKKKNTNSNTILSYKYVVDFQS